MVTVISASFNKHEYVLDAIKSIQNQTYTDWKMLILENSTDKITRKKINNYTKDDKRIKVFERDYTDKERKKFYVVARWINQCMREANKNNRNGHIFWISDDDLIDEDFFEKAIVMNKPVVYGRTLVLVEQPDGTFKQDPDQTQHHGDSIGKGSATSPDCVIDGGSIFIESTTLDKISYPYYPEDMHKDITHHCDGIFMNKLANHFAFYSLDANIYHRITKKSTWVN